MVSAARRENDGNGVIKHHVSDCRLREDQRTTSPFRNTLSQLAICNAIPTVGAQLKRDSNETLELDTKPTFIKGNIQRTSYDIL